LVEQPTMNVEVVVDDQQCRVALAEVAQRAHGRELIALVSLLIAPLDHGGAAVQRLLSDGQRVAALAEGRIDDHVQAAHLRRLFQTAQPAHDGCVEALQRLARGAQRLGDARPRHLGHQLGIFDHALEALLQAGRRFLLRSHWTNPFGFRLRRAPSPCGRSRI
jgi:hypothetical protein